MKWIKPIIIILIITTFLSVEASAELNKSQDEDTQTLIVEIVGKKSSDAINNDGEKKGSSDNKLSLPKTGEYKGVISWQGIGLFGTVLGFSLLICKRGGNKYETD